MKGRYWIQATAGVKVRELYEVDDNSEKDESTKEKCRNEAKGEKRRARCRTVRIYNYEEECLHMTLSIYNTDSLLE